MSNLLNLIIEHVIAVFLLLLVGTPMFMLTIHFMNEDLRDDLVQQTLNVVADRYPPSFVGTARYWEDRNYFYRSGACSFNHSSSTCSKGSEYSHRTYVNHKWKGVYDRADKLGVAYRHPPTTY